MREKSKQQVLSKEEIRLYFDDEASRDEIKDPYISTMYWQKKRDIINLLPENAENILDVGCGTGRFEEILLGQGFNIDVIAIDISKKSIHVAKSKLNSEKFEFLCGDVASLPFKDDSFDCCVLIEVIEHISNKESVLKELKRVLKTRGKLIITTPNKRDVILRIHNLFLKLGMKIARRRIVHKDEYVSTKELSTLVEGAGLHTCKKLVKYLNPLSLPLRDKVWGLSPPLPPFLNLQWLKFLLRIEEKYNIPDFIRERLCWTIFICAVKEDQYSRFKSSNRIDAAGVGAWSF